MLLMNDGDPVVTPPPGSLATGESWGSAVFIPGVSGWQIKADGSAEFNNVLIRGRLDAVGIET